VLAVSPRFVERLSGAVEFKQLLVSGSQPQLVSQIGAGDGLFGRGNRVGKPPGFRVSRGQRSDANGALVASQRAGALCQMDGFRAVADVSRRACGQNPGQVIERSSEIRLHVKRLAIVPDRFGSLALTIHNQGQIELGFRPAAQ
jgi:hypothetical protein